MKWQKFFYQAWFFFVNKNTFGLKLLRRLDSLAYIQNISQFSFYSSMKEQRVISPLEQRSLWKMCHDLNRLK